MKLTERQKKILLISAFFFFLTLAVITSTFLLVNKNQKNTSPQIPGKNDFPSDKLGLAKTKTETIAFLRQKLSANNIKNDGLLKELKDNNYLTAGKTN